MAKGKITYLIAFIYAIILVALLNITAIAYLFQLFDKKEFMRLSSNEIIKFNHIIWWLIYQVIVFVIVSVFNYTWLEKYNTRFSKKQTKIGFRILAHILLFVILAFIGHLLAPSLLNKQHYYTFIILLKKNLLIEFAAIIVAFISIEKLKSRQKTIENLKLKEEKLKAELNSLKEQISPHFLFNTLNTLSSIIRTKEKPESIAFVDDLSAVYRYILDSNKSDLVTIADELSFLEAYKHLLQNRFGNGFKIEINIDSKIKFKKIPPMALQILIENVFKHNIISQKKPIITKIWHDDFYLFVENNINLKENVVSHGIGLANLEKRYRILTEKSILISIIDTSFIVKLPIIKE